MVVALFVSSSRELDCVAWVRIPLGGGLFPFAFICEWTVSKFQVLASKSISPGEFLGKCDLGPTYLSYLADSAHLNNYH